MYAEVLLPQKVGFGPPKSGIGTKNIAPVARQTLTYRIPAAMPARLGQIVEVPLRNRLVKGAVFNFFDEEPAFKTKDIAKIVENAPHLESWQIPLMKWISEYYFSPLFKTLKLFLPVPFIKKKKLKPRQGGAEISAYEFNPQHRLSEEQKEVLKQFESGDKTVTLLHGITGSGKTEIYLHAADAILKRGKQVLMLIPEISLTPQTVQRFSDHFKQKVAIIHSHLTQKEKELEWMSIHKGEARIIIGSRSAIFAPFPDLGVIIMDEEHDGCYKQDQSPRYNTLDVAVQMAQLLKIKILTGSATPSLETYYKAVNGEYRLLELKNRPNAENAGLPTTHIVDLREEIKKKNFSIFSEILQKKLRDHLAAREQSILFLNRRGAASAVICRECGFVVKCALCEVPMTYHKRFTVEDSVYHAERLICHHCGQIEKVPHLCPNCQSPYIRYIGLGTQRVEDELVKLLPTARVLRADSDTAKKKNSFKIIYETFKNHQADVLIGTQMIAFGLHIPKVNLVGIILADLGLTIPNFRSSERTFQLITQVAGRAGRECVCGEVIIQTYLPEHYAIKKAAAHDYNGFFEEELAIRKSLNYPPFSKLIKLTAADPNNKKCLEKVTGIFNELQKLNTAKGHEITYYPSLIPKFRNKYRWHILISGPNPAELLRKLPPTEDIVIDVDPLSTV